MVGVSVGRTGVQVDVAVSVGGMGMLVAAGLGVLVGVGVGRALEPQPVMGTRASTKLVSSASETSVCRR